MKGREGGAATNWPRQNARTSFGPWGQHQRFDMTFSQSVRSALVDKYANFKGTASRSEFWWFLLFYILVLGFIGELLGELLYLACFLLLFIPMCAVWVRRCHGAGHSTLEAVILFVLYSSWGNSPSMFLDFFGVSSGTAQTIVTIFFCALTGYMFALAMAKDKIVLSLRQAREEWNDPAKKSRSRRKIRGIAQESRGTYR